MIKHTISLQIWLPWILERILGGKKQNNHAAFNHVGETIK